MTHYYTMTSHYYINIVYGIKKTKNKAKQQTSKIINNMF